MSDLNNARLDEELRRRVRALVVDTSPSESDPRVAYLIRHWDVPARQARDMIVGLDALPGWTHA